MAADPSKILENSYQGTRRYIPDDWNHSPVLTLQTLRYSFFFVWTFLPVCCRCRRLLFHLISLFLSLTHTHTHTHTHTQYDSSGRGIDPSQRILTTQNIHKRHSCPRGYSNPQSQQARGCTPTSYIARPPGSATT